MFSKSKPSLETAPSAAPRNRDIVSNSPRSSGHTFSMIASDVEITGNLSARVDLHIDGKVMGDVSCGSLVQGESSVISGKVTAEVARLSGKVDGSIEAGELIIEASARITGDVCYQNLTIAPGGQVDGKFKHKAAGSAPNIRKTTIEIGGNDPLILGHESKVA
jgi:cytoskeletal protein CcmA (bactofilin family)